MYVGRPHRDALSSAGTRGISGDGPGDAEVRQHGAAGRRLDEHVFRLYVAVDHARSGGGVERRGEIGRDPAGLLEIDASVAGQSLPQALALDLVHHVIEESVRGAGGVHGHDVRMAQASDGARFGEESTGDRRVRGQLGVDDLDRYWPVERGVGGPVDNSHPSATQLAIEPVLRTKRGLQRRERIGEGFHHGIRRLRKAGCKYTHRRSLAGNGCVPQGLEMFRVESKLTS